GGKALADKYPPAATKRSADQRGPSRTCLPEQTAQFVGFDREGALSNFIGGEVELAEALSQPRHREVQRFEHFEGGGHGVEGGRVGGEVRDLRVHEPSAEACRELANETSARDTGFGIEEVGAGRDGFGGSFGLIARERSTDREEHGPPEPWACITTEPDRSFA